jgi:predicted patatin/cPLA2 family phospholipase
MKTYITYTKNQTKQVKQGLKEGKTLQSLAQELSNEWSLPFNGVYQKIRRVSKTKRKYVKREPQTTPVVKTTGMELTGGIKTAFLKNFKTPAKVVLYDDHIRYYFN